MSEWLPFLVAEFIQLAATYLVIARLHKRAFKDGWRAGYLNGVETAWEKQAELDKQRAYLNQSHSGRRNP